MKTFLERNYNPVNQCSPSIPEYLLDFKVDEDGASYPVAVKTDSKKILEGLGKAEMYTIENLQKAGINPASLSVHTGYATRLEAEAALGSVEADLTSFLDTQITEQND